MTAAHALNDQTGIVAEAIRLLISGAGLDADGPVRSKLAKTFRRVDTLRSARSEDELETAFDQMATRRFGLEVAKLLKDPFVARVIRCGQAREVAGRTTSAKNQRAQEFLDDLRDGISLFASLPANGSGPAKPTGKMAEGFAAWFTSAAALSLASYSSDDWEDWKVGMLWNFGRRAVVDTGKLLGLRWEDVVDATTTPRDRSLLARPFDQAASDEAARVLGL